MSGNIEEVLSVEIYLTNPSLDNDSQSILSLKLCYNKAGIVLYCTCVLHKSCISNLAYITVNRLKLECLLHVEHVSC